MIKYLGLGCIALCLCACDAKAPAKIADEPVAYQAKPGKAQRIMVLLDVQIGSAGEVLEAKLAQGQADTLFAKAALLEVKQQQFAIRYQNEQPISYWLTDVQYAIGTASPVAEPEN